MRSFTTGREAGGRRASRPQIELRLEVIHVSGTTRGARGTFSVLRIALIGAAALAGTLLMAGQAKAAFPSGSNGKLVYMTQDGGDNDVFVMNADGSGKVNLTSAITDNDYNPAFSPDGTKIVFASDRPGSTSNDIWVMNADGSNPVNLTPGLTGTQELPTWSPDGTKIAYTDEDVGGGDTFVMNADGSGKVDLTTDNPSEWDSQPNYSPDGSKIAYTRCDTTTCVIETMNADGSGKAPLTTPSGTDGDYSPYYSPD